MGGPAAFASIVVVGGPAAFKVILVETGPSAYRYEDRENRHLFSDLILAPEMFPSCRWHPSSLRGDGSLFA